MQPRQPPDRVAAQESDIFRAGNPHPGRVIQFPPRVLHFGLRSANPKALNSPGVVGQDDLRIIHVQQFGTVNGMAQVKVAILMPLGKRLHLFAWYEQLD